MREYIFINEDGTVHNILNLVGPGAIEANEDLKDLLYFDYTDWADKPGPGSTYNRETETWTSPVPPITSVVVEHLRPIETEIAEDELAGGQE
jgi:hypothetical protein